MPEFFDTSLINLIITRIYTIVAALIISIPISFLQSTKSAPSMPLLWGGLNKLFLDKLIKLNAPQRTDQDLFFRGLIVTCLFIVLSAVIVIILRSISFSPTDYQLLEIIILACCITSITPILLNRKLQKSLSKNSKVDTKLQNAISISTMRAVNTADKSAYNRYTITLTIYSFVRHYIMPIFFFIIGGLPLLIISSIFGWLSYAIGKNALTGPYSFTITIFEEIITTIPNFIASTLLVMASLITPKANTKQALNALSMKHSGYFLPGAHPLAITAHSINVSIGGKEKARFGAMIEKPWYGPKDAKANIDVTSVRQAQYMIAVSQLLTIFALVIFL